MPFRFFRSVRLGKGLHLNFSRSGLGLSQKIGPLTLGTRRTTLNLPGTGASFYVINSVASRTSSLKSASTQAWALLITAFVAIMSCICLGFAYIVGGSSGSATPILAIKPQPISFPSKTFTSADSILPTSTLANLFTRTAVPPPTRRATWTAEPATGTPKPIIPIVPILPGSGNTGGVCSCKGDTLNCRSFSSQSAAQACFNYCIQKGRGDIHKLDQNNNGLACEGN